MEQKIIDAIQNQKKYFKNADGSFKTNEEGEKVEKPPLKENTIKTYISNLKKIDDNIEDLSWTDKFPAVVDKLQKMKLKHTTQKNYLNSLIVIMEALQLYPDTRKKYIALRDKFNKEYEKENETGIISDKQAPNFVTREAFDKMVEQVRKEVVFKKLKQVTNPTLDERNLFQLFVILQMYRVLPVRNELATLQKISKSDYDKLSDEDKLKANYLIIGSKNKMSLSLGEYKTAKKYGVKEIEMPVVAKRLLTIWFNRYNRENNHVFIQKKNEPLSKNNLTKMLTRASEKYMDGKKISTTMIRKIYLSDKYADKNEEQKKDSDKMGHSIETQNKVYIKKPQTEV